MGFSTLLQSDICSGFAFGFCEQRSSSRNGGGGATCSYVLGRALRQPGRVYAVNIDRKFVVAAAMRQNECSGEEKREVEEKNQLLGVASASIGFNAVLLMAVTKPVLPGASQNKDAPWGWVSLPLVAVWGAILLNALVQYRILERLTCFPPQHQQNTSPGLGRVDFTLKQRVADLEGNVREFVTTARGLSKQVEKLGLRFMATQRTLRDPMQETTAFALKTSEVATILAQREDRLEEELKGLQRALLAMQDHQVKQLALISLALGRTRNNNGAQTKQEKLLERSVNVNVNGSGSSRMKTLADTNASGGVLKAAETPKEPVNGTLSSGRSNNISEESLSKVDFWKDCVTPYTVVEKLTVGTSSPASENSKLGSFVHGRKTRKATPGPESPLEKAELQGLESEVGDSDSFVERPDIDSDGWLR